MWVTRMKGLDVEWLVPVEVVRKFGQARHGPMRLNAVSLRGGFWAAGPAPSLRFLGGVCSGSAQLVIGVRLRWFAAKWMGCLSGFWHWRERSVSEKEPGRILGLGEKVDRADFQAAADLAIHRANKQVESDPGAVVS